MKYHRCFIDEALMKIGHEKLPKRAMKQQWKYEWGFSDEIVVNER